MVLFFFLVDCGKKDFVKTKLIRVRQVVLSSLSIRVMRIEVVNSRANNYMSFYLQEGISMYTQ